MAKIVLTEPFISLDGVDLSDHITSVALGTVYDLVEVTEMGNIAKKFVGGLENNTLALEIQQDFGIGEVESVIYPNRGLRINAIVRPVDGPRSATNPEYTFQVLVSEWAPLTGSIGNLATVSISWPIFGEITKTT